MDAGPKTRDFYAINQLVDGCLPDKYVFGCKRHLMELTKFVPLDKMKQLFVAYMASKRGPSLITMRNKDIISKVLAAGVTCNNQRPKESELIYFQMMLKTLLNPAIQIYPPDQQAQEKLFQNIIQYRNRSAWKEERLCPQSYID